MLYTLDDRGTPISLTLIKFNVNFETRSSLGRYKVHGLAVCTDYRWYDLRRRGLVKVVISQNNPSKVIIHDHLSHPSSYLVLGSPDQDGG